MSIAVYMPIIIGGYGDLIFGLKVVHELKKYLREQGYHRPIYLVTRDNEKKLILQLDGHSEFDTEIKSVDEFNQSEDAKKLDYLIQGPAFSHETWGEIKIPNTTPILLVSEYSTEIDDYEKEKKYLQNKHSNIIAIQSGFDTTTDSSELGHGILFSEELSQAAEAKRDDRFDFREKYWANLDKYSKRLLQGESIENYHQSTELSFEYSHNTLKQCYAYHHGQNTCARYLHIHQLFNENSNKNQAIFSVGKKRKYEGNKKKAALIELLPTLKKNGYDKVIYIDLESGKDDILYENKGKKLSKKTYQFFHAQQVTHKEIIALLALSGPLVGATGDQSFGEALSSEKLIVYECIDYKEKLAEEFIKTFQALDVDNKKASRLAELLIKAKVTSDQDEADELQALLQDSTIVKQYQTICRKIQEKHNLGKNIISIISPVVNLAIHSQKNNNTPILSSTDSVEATGNQKYKNSLSSDILLFGYPKSPEENVSSSELKNLPSCSRFF